MLSQYKYLVRLVFVGGGVVFEGSCSYLVRLVFVGGGSCSRGRVRTLCGLCSGSTPENEVGPRPVLPPPPPALADGRERESSENGSDLVRPRGEMSAVDSCKRGQRGSDGGQRGQMEVRGVRWRSDGRAGSDVGWVRL